MVERLGGEFGIIIGVMVIVLLVVVRYWVAWRRTHYTFSLFTLILIVRCLTFWRWRNVSTSPFPLVPGQGAVIVANHRSSVDPYFIQLKLNRPVHWMVAREYCEHKIFGWFLRICEVISVGRGGIDTAAIKTAVRLASAGHLVGLFPEGRINMSEEPLLPARPGAALVALKAGVPIIPCFIEGAPYEGTALSPFFMSSRVGVHVGTPIHVDRYNFAEDREQALRSIMLDCLTQLGKLAGHADFVPQIAGRRWKPSDVEVQADVQKLKERP
ncbi:MAG: 1-acyl-sn-glycerol-3-phosphate acyltransferase [Pirellulaceae bacterium]|nr:1-acyl-sn-glycerol-3-phosphate acyltransferase [Pirellulaceae bacterium]